MKELSKILENERTSRQMWNIMQLLNNLGTNTKKLYLANAIIDSQVSHGNKLLIWKQVKSSVIKESGE